MRSGADIQGQLKAIACMIDKNYMFIAGLAQPSTQHQLGLGVDERPFCSLKLDGADFICWRPQQATPIYLNQQQIFDHLTPVSLIEQ